MHLHIKNGVKNYSLSNFIFKILWILILLCSIINIIPNILDKPRISMILSISFLSLLMSYYVLLMGVKIKEVKVAIIDKLILKM